MKSASIREALLVAAVWAAAVFICLALGARNGLAFYPGQGPPPPCILCDCYEVFFWTAPNAPLMGAFQTNGEPATNTTAFLNMTVSATCQKGPLIASETYDRWDIPQGYNQCTPPNGNIYQWELGVDPPYSVVDGTQKNTGRSICTP